MQMDLPEANARLSEVIAAAERSEEVAIACDGVPVIRIIPAVSRKIRLGLLECQVSKDSIPDFSEPMTEAELATWGA